MEKIIEEKLKKQQSSDYCDAFDYMLSSAKEDDYELTMQELKVNLTVEGQIQMYCVLSLYYYLALIILFCRIIFSFHH